MRPFSIRLFAPSGDPNGVLVASRDDWTGRAVIFPRDLVGVVKGRKEYKQPGVYILTGKKQMYIGEGDPLGPRIDEHIKTKDFWARCVFFTSDANRLNKAHVQFLEHKLTTLAKEVNRVKLTNVHQPTQPELTEEEQAFIGGFFQDILLMLPLLGFYQFESDEDSDDESTDEAAEEAEEARASGGGKRAEMYSAFPRGLHFSLNSKGIKAELELVDGGVLVKKGSQVVDPISATFQVHAPSYAATRQQLLESGVLAKEKGALIFTVDQFFTSGSTAASIIRGTNSNSWWWKTKDGITLGQMIRDRKQGNK